MSSRINNLIPVDTPPLVTNHHFINDEVIGKQIRNNNNNTITQPQEQPLHSANLYNSALSTPETPQNYTNITPDVIKRQYAPQTSTTTPNNQQQQQNNKMSLVETINMQALEIPKLRYETNAMDNMLKMRYALIQRYKYQLSLPKMLTQAQHDKIKKDDAVFGAKIDQTITNLTAQLNRIVTEYKQLNAEYMKLQHRYIELQNEFTKNVTKLWLSQDVKQQQQLSIESLNLIAQTHQDDGNDDSDDDSSSSSCSSDDDHTDTTSSEDEDEEEEDETDSPDGVKYRDPDWWHDDFGDDRSEYEGDDDKEHQINIYNKDDLTSSTKNKNKTKNDEQQEEKDSSITTHQFEIYDEISTDPEDCEMVYAAYHGSDAPHQSTTILQYQLRSLKKRKYTGHFTQKCVDKYKWYYSDDYIGVNYSKNNNNNTKNTGNHSHDSNDSSNNNSGVTISNPLSSSSQYPHTIDLKIITNNMYTAIQAHHNYYLKLLLSQSLKDGGILPFDTRTGLCRVLDNGINNNNSSSSGNNNGIIESNPNIFAFALDCNNFRAFLILFDIVQKYAHISITGNNGTNDKNNQRSNSDGGNDNDSNNDKNNDKNNECDKKPNPFKTMIISILYNTIQCIKQENNDNNHDLHIEYHDLIFGTSNNNTNVNNKNDDINNNNNTVDPQHAKQLQLNILHQYTQFLHAKNIVLNKRKYKQHQHHDQNEHNNTNTNEPHIQPSTTTTTQKHISSHNKALVCHIPYEIKLAMCYTLIISIRALLK